MDVALFGAGRIGKIHAGQRRPPARRHVALCRGRRCGGREVAPQQARRAGRSVEAALADNAVGAVVIGSSTDTHSDLITRSAAAGKAIFCEKPVDLSEERCAGVRRRGQGVRVSRA
jgi:myo-inositol 2-dehydrogenase/D-chiro-inositol 1-dehydrogenase